MFTALGRLTYRRRWPVLLVSALVLAGSVAGLLRGGALSSGQIEGVEAESARRLAEQELNLPGDSSFTIIFLSPVLQATEPEYREALTAALAPLRSDPRVASVLAPDQAPPPVAARLMSKDRRSALAIVNLKAGYRQAAAEYPALRGLVQSVTLFPIFTGYLAFRSDLDRVLERDLLLAEAVSLPLTVLVLLLAFRSVMAAVLPVAVGSLAVAGGVAAIMALSHVTDMAAYAVNVASLIGLGVAIDYSLFIVSRYRDELAAGASYAEALPRALGTAGRAVAFSGLAVGVGLSGLVFFRGSFLASMGLAGAIVVVLAVVFALTFLPALLAVLGPRIHAGTVRLPFQGSSAGLWRWVAEWVMARPVLVLVPTLAVVLSFGVPFWQIRLAGTDVKTLPASVESRQGYALLTAQFPDQVANRVLVVVRFPSAPAFTPDRAAALYDLSQRLRGLPGVRDVQSIVDLGPGLTRETYAALAAAPPDLRPPEAALAFASSVGEHAVLLQVVTDLPPASKAAADLVQAIRAQRGVADGSLLVGGQAALDLDVTDFILERAPKAIAFVVAVTYLVLLVPLGSVVLPLKAVVVNFLSITASFGALVWIFQDGHMETLLRFEPGPIDPTLPVLLFCTVFGLSMDYEVLMLTRMQEDYERTGDNTRAVAEGLERTGKLVTSAAAVMVAVFSAFALAQVVVVKAMGVALALAVALDATIVRVLIVPATMRLFGDFNWWAPAPLARLFRRLRPGN